MTHVSLRAPAHVAISGKSEVNLVGERPGSRAPGSLAIQQMMTGRRCCARRRRGLSIISSTTCRPRSIHQACGCRPSAAAGERLKSLTAASDSQQEAAETWAKLNQLRTGVADDTKR